MVVLPGILAVGDSGKTSKRVGRTYTEAQESGYLGIIILDLKKIVHHLIEPKWSFQKIKTLFFKDLIMGISVGRGTTT